MRIAVDCRYLGRSGIGRVTQGILEHLDERHEYVLIGSPSALKGYPAAEIVEDETSPFSVRGMLRFPALHGCDALIVPNFIIPFGVKVPVFSVMHDLIFLDLPKIATRGVFDRIVKRYFLSRCMKKSRRVLCVSEFTRQRAAHYFPKQSTKCYVAYNGLSERLLSFPVDGNKREKTLVYVGNIKPHKGLKTLLDAFRMLPEGYTLEIIGEKDGFLTGVKEGELDFSQPGITFTGRLPEEDLYKAIASASFLVQPSYYEGFGLPPLEALCLGTKPILSDIPVFREIYSAEQAEFFRVGDAESLCACILHADPVVADRRHALAERFSFAAFTQKLLREVEACCSPSGKGENA